MSANTVFEFGRLVNDHEEFIQWMNTMNLLPTRRKCSTCGENMKKIKNKDSFSCSKRSLHPNGKLLQISSRTGTLFEGTLILFAVSSGLKGEGGGSGKTVSTERENGLLEFISIHSFMC